ncbi:MAG: hypothetical protein A4E30_01305 [Methanomassiliicoccales archaeon PtaB.Bin215]|nr:MAG: hypothetical protein A4E30_01305 [Methanomassiliicoccales archaeon PtaB.Bin215]
MITEDFAAYAARLRIGFPTDVPADQLQGMLESFMSGVAMDCLEAGTRLIGHIKCLVEGSDEIIACSVTDHDARVRCRGRFETPRAQLDVIINVLQYGLRKQDLVRIVAACGKRSFAPQTSMTIEDLEIEEKQLIQLG